MPKNITSICSYNLPYSFIFSPDNFLISNRGVGPKGEAASIGRLEIGDVIQLSFNGTSFTHSLVVVQSGITINDTFVAAHTFDTFGKRVSDYYEMQKYRCIHIL